jgi:hypothetical protein
VATAPTRTIWIRAAAPRCKWLSHSAIRRWHIIEDSLDVRAAAASGVLIIATLISMLLMERLAGLSRQFC